MCQNHVAKHRKQQAASRVTSLACRAVQGMVMQSGGMLSWGFGVQEKHDSCLESSDAQLTGSASLLPSTKPL